MREGGGKGERKEKKKKRDALLGLFPFSSRQLHLSHLGAVWWFGVRYRRGKKWRGEKGGREGEKRGRKGETTTSSLERRHFSRSVD